MFSTGHILWIGISTLLIAGGLLACLCVRPPLKKLFSVGLALGLLSEVVKLFSAAVIVPMVDPVVAAENGTYVLQWVPSGEYTPYLAMEHLPLELCSLYLLFMLLSLAVKDGPWKKGLYAVMFASGTLGGVMGIVLASIAGDFESVGAFFASPRAWQYFLYHAMIVTLSLYLGFGREAGLVPSDWKKALTGLLLLDLPTFYLNSAFSNAVYVRDQVVGVTHRINFFSSYVNPLGLVLTEKWQWIAYLAIRAALAAALVRLLFVLISGKRGGRKVHGRDTA